MPVVADVEQHPVARAAGPVEPLHPFPVDQGLDHRVLHQVLGVARGARQGGGNGDEAPVLAAIEVLEVDPSTT